MEPRVVKRTITLLNEHDNWVRSHHISLSRFIRSKIDEEILSSKNYGVA